MVMPTRFWQTNAPFRQAATPISMAQARRPLSPHLQISKPMYTMVLSITHRLTGVFLSIGLLFFVYWLGALASDAPRYASVRECMGAGWVKLLMVGFLFSFFYHLCNGIRHLTWDLGYCLER